MAVLFFSRENLWAAKTEASYTTGFMKEGAYRKGPASWNGISYTVLHYSHNNKKKQQEQQEQEQLVTWGSG